MKHLALGLAESWRSVMVVFNLSLSLSLCLSHAPTHAHTHSLHHTMSPCGHAYCAHCPHGLHILMALSLKAISHKALSCLSKMIVGWLPLALQMSLLTPHHGDMEDSSHA